MLFFLCFAVHESGVDSEERPRKNQKLSRASTNSPSKTTSAIFPIFLEPWGRASSQPFLIPALPVVFFLYVLSHEVERTIFPSSATCPSFPISLQPLGKMSSQKKQKLSPEPVLFLIPLLPVPLFLYVLCYELKHPCKKTKSLPRARTISLCEKLTPFT